MKNWFAGMQWFFFIFANTIVIPITIGAAFETSQQVVISLIQMSFIITGLACLLQALFGHRKPLLEGQSGLWWGIYLTLATTAAVQGMSLTQLGGSLAVGVMISGLVTIIVGMTGIGYHLARFFRPNVMGVFLFLLGVTLTQIFFKGMLGIPFGPESDQAMINISVTGLTMVIALLVIVLSMKAPGKVKSYAILIGILIGWLLYVLIFGGEKSAAVDGSMMIFPLGPLQWDTGIVVICVIAGLLNMSNTYGVLKGVEGIYGQETKKKEYNFTFSITGLATVLAGAFGIVPYAPYVSSVGYLRQTGIYERLPFMIGSSLFLMMGIIQPIGQFFATLPLSIGSAVLFVAYLQMLHASFDFFKQITFNAYTIYRAAIPLFVGIVIMMMPTVHFESLPEMIRPFVSNGLLMGILLAVIIENTIDWEKVGRVHI